MTNPAPKYIVFVGMDGFDVLVETSTIREVARLPAVLPTDLFRTGHPLLGAVRPGAW